MQLKFSFFIIIASFFVYESIDVPNRVIFDHIGNELLWNSNSTLTWSDFKGDIDEDATNVVASTQCEIKVLSISLTNRVPNYVIGNYFIKDKSWSKVSDSLTLIHEQLHFDIFELYTRKLRKEFKRLKSIKETDSNIYNTLFLNFTKEAFSMNKKYDGEVYFNNKKQQEWIAEISKELIYYEEYSFENCYNHK